MFRLCRIAILIFTTALSGGCTSTTTDRASSHLIVIVPGAGGDGLGYNALVDEIQRAVPSSRVERFSWGTPVFLLNFSNQGVHNRAETLLARRIQHHWAVYPQGQVDLIGHSAGGGVVLGAIGRLPADASVGRVILLHPSVSPGYDLKDVLKRTALVLNFWSWRDKFFLKWRVTTFGGYDRRKEPAAGYEGFQAQASNLIQIPFDDTWSRFGHNGGHFGPLSRHFVREVVVRWLKE